MPHTFRTKPVKRTDDMCQKCQGEGYSEVSGGWAVVQKRHRGVFRSVKGEGGVV